MNTNIFGTIGPSFHTYEDLKKAAELGMRGVRINLSHGSLASREEWLEQLRLVQKEYSLEIIMDMQGPELRTGFLKKPIMLEGVMKLKELPLPRIVVEQWQKGEILLLDDGKLKLVRKDNDLVEVITGGYLESAKSAALQHSVILPVCTEEDCRNMKDAAAYGITGIMQPFVRSRDDMLQLKEIMKQNHAEHLKIYAKIEDNTGVEHIREICRECDVVVIARGDLGNSMPLSKLPYVQKYISDQCVRQKASFMVVTQMLNSMIEHPFPTRAEVSDIFHAVIDGADYVMLTGETAAGKYPLEALKMMIDTVAYAERYLSETE